MNSKKIKRVALYARVSTNKKDENRQEVETQLLQLREHCIKEGWTIYEEYIDHQSGAKSNRLGLDKLFEDASQRKFDLVLFWSLDRFSREGAFPTMQKLQLLNHYGVEFFSHTEAYLNTTGVFKDAVIGILATISKQERIRHVERVNAGLDRAKKQGKKLGRKPTPQSKVDEVIKLKGEGLTIRGISKKVGLSLGKVSGILKDL